MVVTEIKTRTITVYKSAQSIRHSAKFIAKRATNSSKVFFLQMLPIISIATALFAVLYFYTGGDDYILLKALSLVLLVLWWLVMIILIPFIIYGTFKYKYTLESILITWPPEACSYEVAISQSDVVIKTQESVLNYPWTIFAGYGIDYKTVYVFNRENPLQMLFWTEEELGINNYIHFLNLLQENLGKRKF